jgi:acyl-CoA thioesterase-1
MMPKSISMLLSCFVLMAGCLAGCNRQTLQKTVGTPGQQMSSATGRSGSSPGSGIDKKASAETSPQAASDTRPVIVAFGDSLTAGYGTNAGESYPDYLQHDLNARGFHYRVVNEGISGNTSKDGVVRARQIAALHPAAVIVAFGGNDGLRGIPISDTEMNLETIISTLQDAHIKVILGGITLPPNYGSTYIAKFNAMYVKQAETYHLPWLPFMLKGVYGTPGGMQNDGIHATAKGNQQVARNFLPLLLPLLHK